MAKIFSVYRLPKNMEKHLAILCSNLTSMTFIIDYYIIKLRLTTTWINVQITLTLTMTTADEQRTIHISLQNFEE